MREYDVVSVQPVGEGRLQVRFADGVTGEVLLRASFFRGVFEPLREESTFNRVHCNQGFVEWPGDLDLAPDAMHQAIKSNGIWILD